MGAGPVTFGTLSGSGPALQLNSGSRWLTFPASPGFTPAWVPPGDRALEKSIASGPEMSRLALRSCVLTMNRGSPPPKELWARLVKNVLLPNGASCERALGSAGGLRLLEAYGMSFTRTALTAWLDSCTSAMRGIPTTAAWRLRRNASSPGTSTAAARTVPVFLLFVSTSTTAMAGGPDRKETAAHRAETPSLSATLALIVSFTWPTRAVPRCSALKLRPVKWASIRTPCGSSGSNGGGLGNVVGGVAGDFT
mmetsp:Transcript_18958/g.53467  ORF Transcript_18958/g.53467 Transcript_18958/m.53467 type:complete len:252 (+) Transcript_18958:451-1206(+)